jgi:tetratricopeptide (TPR) repeat protein
LAELTRAHLLTEHMPGRYSMHDLLRLYAHERALAEESAEERRAAERRMLDYYLHSSFAAAVRQVPYRDLIELAPPVDGVQPERPADLGAAVAWFATERLVLLRAIEQAVREGFDTYAWQLAWTLLEALHRMARWGELLEINQLVLGDQPWSAHAVEGLARAGIALGRLAEAEGHLDRLLAMHRAAADVRGQATAHIGFQMLRNRQGRYVDALEHAQQALVHFSAAGAEVMVGAGLNNIAFAYTRLGDPHRAVDHARRALIVLERSDDPNLLASVWDTLGAAYEQLGQVREAIAAYTRTRELLRLIASEYREAAVLVKLGDLRSAAGDSAGAGEAWTEALALMAGMNHSETGEVRQRLRTLRDGERPSGVTAAR